MLPLSYHVAPRYSVGSPGMVPPDIATDVAVDELRAYSHARTWARGFVPSLTAQADTGDLVGIVYSTVERGSRVYVFDELTGRVYEVPVRYWGKHTKTGAVCRWYDRNDREQFRIDHHDAYPAVVGAWAPLLSTCVGMVSNGLLGVGQLDEPAHTLR